MVFPLAVFLHYIRKMRPLDMGFESKQFCRKMTIICVCIFWTKSYILNMKLV
ncbi:hypothetical protein HMPREF8571_0235 [Streptococcus mitis ATCC 6249]|uniref:Uncharacterized protein n=1 Tax=Streptococcus mitis ATCC 6249 TaxID=864567 RepID=E0PNW8_STRMT|nr:hypothetical protein HMPREF8571_0235 [Streptococcus mitis ATCC 6249]